MSGSTGLMCQFQAVYTTFLKSLDIVTIAVHASLSVATILIRPILPVILYTIVYVKARQLHCNILNLPLQAAHLLQIEKQAWFQSICIVTMSLFTLKFNESISSKCMVCRR